MARSSPSRRLMSDDLPTFGRPMIATTGKGEEADGASLNVLVSAAGAYGPSSGPPLTLLRVGLPDGQEQVRLGPLAGIDAGGFGDPRDCRSRPRHHPRNTIRLHRGAILRAHGCLLVRRGGGERDLRSLRRRGGSWERHRHSSLQGHRVEPPHHVACVQVQLIDVAVSRRQIIADAVAWRAGTRSRLRARIARAGCRAWFRNSVLRSAVKT